MGTHEGEGREVNFSSKKVFSRTFLFNFIWEFTKDYKRIYQQVSCSLGEKQKIYLKYYKTTLPIKNIKLVESVL